MHQHTQPNNATIKHNTNNPTTNLQDPVRAREEAAEAEAEDVVRRKALHHFGLLHHAQLREHRHRLEVHAPRPPDAEGQPVAGGRVREDGEAEAGGEDQVPFDRVQVGLVRGGDLGGREHRVQDRAGGDKGEGVE